jgi:hypothetical protein
MSIKDKKQKVFGQIGAAKTLVNGMPKYNLTNSFPSVNNGNDPILFLTDLLIRNLNDHSNALLQ